VPAPDQLTVLIMAPSLGSDLSFIEALDPGLKVVDGNAAYLAELEERGLPSRRKLAAGIIAPSPAVWEKLLADADIIVTSHPVLPDLGLRAPRAKWMHHVQAGVSNLWASDLWESNVVLTTGRGSVGATSIAEYVIAGVLYFSRGFHESVVAKQQGQLNHTTRDRMTNVGGATLGIVGLGGIGKELARLGKALGMRVLATRLSLHEELHDTDNADVVMPAARLLNMAEQSDFLVFCAQLTPETRGMINGQVFENMKPTAVFINVARGEVVNEDDLVEALRQESIRGAVLDVYARELEGQPPRREFLEWPQVLLTPHISAQRGSGPDEAMRGLLKENLRRYLSREPLLNVVDRARGY
jgi:phosphoglycerate dehydrogenase-like enzyme